MECRFQYLELAYFLIHGRCPVQSDTGYILSTGYGQWPDGGFQEFYQQSSAILNLETDSFKAKETTLAATVANQLVPLRTSEHRTFLYTDSHVCSYQTNNPPPQTI